MKWHVSVLVLERLPILVRESDRDLVRHDTCRWSVKRISRRLLGVFSGVSLPVTTLAWERPCDF
jgi:hypothetical protein